MAYPRMVLWLRMAAAGLLLIGIVSLAVPVMTFVYDCGSPIDRTEPTASQAWDDIYAFTASVEHCPGLLRLRRVVGGAAVLGALVALALPAFVARGRPGGGPLTGEQRQVVLRTSAVGLLLLAIGAVALPVHGGLSYCGSPLAPDEPLDERCDATLVVRWVVGGTAAIGAVGAVAAAGLPVVARRRSSGELG